MGRIDFPLPFKSLRTITGGDGRAYLVGAMFTTGYSGKAERLAASCEKLGLAYALHEVPTVHRSISIHGTHDLSFTKANFIHHLLTTHNKPILYLDADCEFVSEPDLVSELVKSRCDFAVYNLLADDYTDCFVPIDRSISYHGPPTISNRFYRYETSVDWFTTSQLFACGCVQFYRNSYAARALLSRWHRTVATFPDSADDQCLDFTFNNLGRRSWLSWRLKVVWLPRSYARCSWWIYAEPVINHADYPHPNSNFREIDDPKGRRWYYPSLMEKKKVDCPLPRNCIIDTEQRMLCKVVDGQIVPIERTEQPLWL
jgi:hypothetical protein